MDGKALLAPLKLLLFKIDPLSLSASIVGVDNDGERGELKIISEPEWNGNNNGKLSEAYHVTMSH
jgi:hypothetical protein